MAEGMIDKEIWQTMSPEQKDELVFHYLIRIDTRLQGIESRRWVHAALQSMGGVVGGVAAVAAYLKLLAPLIR